MDKQTALKMLPLINDPNNREALEEYASGRIDRLFSQLEIEKDRECVIGLQARIAELRRFSTLREEVHQKSGKV